MSDDGNGNGSGNGVDVARLFRREGIVSDADLRVDVAREISAMILGDERERLDNKTVNVLGGHVVSAGSRERRVEGNLVSHVHADNVNAASKLEETVLGRVDLRARVEAESIIGGAYVNIVTGGFMRLAVWADYLIWGGYLEADVVRMEVGAGMIRSYMGYVHAAGLRVMAATTLVDDYSNRTEQFGTCNDNTTGDKYLIAPGGGTCLET